MALTPESKGCIALLACGILALAVGIAWALLPAGGSPCDPGIRGPEILFALSFLALSIGAMWSARLWHKDFRHETEGARVRAIKERGHPHGSALERHLIGVKLREPAGLLARDIGPLSFDVATHSDLAEVSEFRGILHWHRDVLEKFLSLVLVVAFSFFLGRAFLYLFDFLKGAEQLTIALARDVSAAALMVGLVLIIDGLILVASMTDAPGIGRTLDSLIVVLSGVVIATFHPHAQSDGFEVRPLPYSGVLLIVVVAVLFIVRWVIRHHTIREWRGDVMTDREQEVVDKPA